MNRLREFVALTGLNIRSWRSRPVASIVVVTGFILVVLVFTVIFSMASGFRATLGSAGAKDVALLLGRGAPNEIQSVFSQNELHLIASAPGVARGHKGSLVAPEVVTTINLNQRSNGAPASVLVRGVGPAMFQIEPQVKIIAGRRFEPGLNEIIVGRRAAQKYRNLKLGSVIRLLHKPWKVVGIFSSGGDVHASEIWADWHMLQSALGYGGAVSGAYVKLRSGADFAAFKAALAKNPQINLSVTRESSYYAQKAAGLSRFITSVGALIALLMAIGAVVGAINIIHSTVSTRSRDMGTLRALGFSRTLVAGSVIVEGLLLGLMGAVIGEAIAYGVFNGFEASTHSGWSAVIFNFSVTPTIIGTGIAIALFMGLVGGLFPAIRSVRLPITKALREC